MSYEINIFFDQHGHETATSAAETLSRLIGVPLKKSDDNNGLYEARLLTLDFLLRRRERHLIDMDGMQFSEYTLQLDIMSHSAGLQIIHPIGIMACESISTNWNGKTMPCLSSLEILGMIFSNGKPLIDNMSNNSRLWSATPWEYRTKRVIDSK